MQPHGRTLSVHPHVALTPDAHLGLGATVGSVIPTLGAIIPAAVGVDIGCGMLAVRTQYAVSDLPEDRKPVRQGIERAVPLNAGAANAQVGCEHTERRLEHLRELASAARFDPGSYAGRWELQWVGGEVERREEIDCQHNHTEPEHHYGRDVWLSRKGAINAEQGRPGLIPGSMGTASYVVTGKGNPVSLNSAPHGAGREYSRTRARRTFTAEDLRRAWRVSSTATPTPSSTRSPRPTRTSTR